MSRTELYPHGFLNHWQTTGRRPTLTLNGSWFVGYHGTFPLLRSSYSSFNHILGSSDSIVSWYWSILVKFTASWLLKTVIVPTHPLALMTHSKRLRLRELSLCIVFHVALYHMKGWISMGKDLKIVQASHFLKSCFLFDDFFVD